MKVCFLRSSSPRPAVPSLRLAHESLLFSQFVTSRGSPGLHASSRTLAFWAFRHLDQQFQAPRELMKFRFLRISSPRATVPNLRQAHESSLFTQFVTSPGSPGLYASSRKLPFYAFRHLAQQFQAPRELMKASFFRISSPCPAVPGIRPTGTG